MRQHDPRCLRLRENLISCANAKNSHSLCLSAPARTIQPPGPPVLVPARDQPRARLLILRISASSVLSALANALLSFCAHSLTGVIPVCGASWNSCRQPTGHSSSYGDGRVRYGRSLKVPASSGCSVESLNPALDCHGVVDDLHDRCSNDCPLHSFRLGASSGAARGYCFQPER